MPVQEPVRPPVKPQIGSITQLTNDSVPERFIPQDGKSHITARIDLPSSTAQTLYTQWEGSIRTLQTAKAELDRAAGALRQANEAHEDAVRIEAQANASFREWMTRQR